MKTMRLTSIVMAAMVVIALLAFGGAAQATIIDLPSTGGAQPVTVPTADPNWIITAQNGSAITPYAAWDLPASEVDLLLSPPAGSNMTPDKMISGSSTGAYLDSYSYTLHFSLAGYQPTTASLSGWMYGDDDVSAVYLNGSAAVGSIGATAWSSGPAQFTITGNFMAGDNTLTITVPGDNDYDYMAVTNLELTATPVPLPGALLLFGPGLVGLAAIRRRFKN